MRGALQKSLECDTSATQIILGHLGFDAHLIYVIKFGTHFCKCLGFNTHFEQIYPVNQSNG